MMVQASHGWKHEALGVGCLLLAGLFFLGLTGSNWRYTPLGGLDNWSYVGYGKHYTDCEYRAGLYKSCRLPWIWWQYTVRNLLQGEPASRGLCYSLLLAWAGGWYLFARQLGSVPAASALAVFSLFYLPGHGSGGWDYHNGASGVFWVLALVQAVWIRKQASNRPRPWILLGACLALAIHTNIILLNTAPLFLALLWPELRKSGVAGFGGRVGWIVAGFVGLTFILGVVNVAIGRRPFFFWKIVQTAFVFVEDTSHNKPLYQPLSAPWIQLAHYLALPAAALLFVVATFFNRASGLARCLCGFHAFLAALWVYWHWKGVTALNIDYIAYPLVLSSLPVCWVALAGKGEKSNLDWRWVLGFVAVGAGMLAAGGWVPDLRVPSPLLFQSLLFFVGLVVLFFVQRFWAGAGLLLLALANAATPVAAGYRQDAAGPDLRLAHAKILDLQDWAWPLRNERPRPPHPTLATVLSGRSFQTDPLARLVWDPDDSTPNFIPFVIALGATDFEMSFPADRQRRIANGTAAAGDFAEMQSGMSLFVADSGQGFTEKVVETLRQLGIPFRRGEAREINLEWGRVRLEQLVFL